MDAPQLKRNSDDVGWEYGVLYDPKTPDKVKCKLCGKEMSGGVFRMKEHIGHQRGNVAACPLSTKEDQAKCMNALKEAKHKKTRKRQHDEELRSEVNINKPHLDDELQEEHGTQTAPHFQGPMDKFANHINPEASLAARTRQQNIHDAISKEKTHVVRQYCARWMYESSIPFNAIDNESFRLFCEALGQFGPGWVPPTQYQLREPLLNEEQERTKKKLKSLEVEWEEQGCSVMTDAWTDMKRRSIMNLCVNSRGGTCFLSSKDTSKDSHTGEFIFKYIEKCIGDIGAKKVVQVVTDNATNNVAAARMLKEMRPNIFWTGCAAHTIDLMLEGVSKLPWFAKVISQAKALTVFVYAHHKTLSMMRAHTKKRDIVRPGATRFATCFLTLQSLHEKKSQLMSMFGSDEWHECKHSKCVKGKQASDTVMSFAFWSSVIMVLKVFSPMVKVLRLADGEKKPSMGFIYGEILEAKKSIKEASNHLEKNYKPIFQIMDEKMKGRLDSPLHLAAYFLNPFYFYKDPNIQYDMEIIEGFIACVETFYYGDFEKQNKVVNDEINLYKNKCGSFGKTLALKGCEQNDETFDPGNWWATYGCHVPTLQKLATRVLALTSSSSGCERNWSSFEAIHTKKRNRLDVNRLNSLVYVQFNARLFNKHKKIKEKAIDVIIDDGNEETVEDWIVEQHQEDQATNVGVVPNTQSPKVRDLYDDDFESEEEDEVMLDMEFEPDVFHETPEFCDTPMGY
ncbi:hypothetical protein ISN45_Aa07g039810 [Arabidopsis thaliana x Arabidopsis arenosa]|uniref:BED-type domain-containing protein n=1 Tax=Arabidopsis thaliana x Arabidopsis arenosa TaxID=1240361 RepID=A0A8T1YDT9_9BRAS|nr:hypothetical protein ISN45_Aa07g039810 [Arabidopsis thaliana x Arabidopsis arenosa]